MRILFLTLYFVADVAASAVIMIELAEKPDDNQLVKTAAEIMPQRNVFGWFQGEMEWGPALWATAASWPIPSART
jgi:hypothetical protein